MRSQADAGVDEVVAVTSLTHRRAPVAGTLSIPARSAAVLVQR